MTRLSIVYSLSRKPRVHPLNGALLSLSQQLDVSGSTLRSVGAPGPREAVESQADLPQALITFLTRGSFQKINVMGIWGDITAAHPRQKPLITDYDSYGMNHYEGGNLSVMHILVWLQISAFGELLIRSL